MFSSLKTESHYAMPALIRDRSLFAFRNGLYNAKTDMFYDWNDVDTIGFQKYACAYHDIEFDYHADANGEWEDVQEWASKIDTSAIDSIFSKQFGHDAADEYRLESDDYFMFLSQVFTAFLHGIFFTYCLNSSFLFVTDLCYECTFTI